jgi:hypothetical protein
MDSPKPIDEQFSYGNDSTPLMNFAPEAPPSHWGVVMTDRKASEAYTKFLSKAKEKNDERK